MNYKNYSFGDANGFLMRKQICRHLYDKFVAMGSLRPFREAREARRPASGAADDGGRTTTGVPAGRFPERWERNTGDTVVEKKEKRLSWWTKKAFFEYFFLERVHQNCN